MCVCEIEIKDRDRESEYENMGYVRLVLKMGGGGFWGENIKKVSFKDYK